VNPLENCSVCFSSGLLYILASDPDADQKRTLCAPRIGLLLLEAGTAKKEAQPLAEGHPPLLLDRAAPMHYPSDGLRMVRGQSTPQRVLCVCSANCYARVPANPLGKSMPPHPLKPRVLQANGGGSIAFRSSRVRLGISPRPCVANAWESQSVLLG
jgi:hypothetical protein